MVRPLSLLSTHFPLFVTAIILFLVSNLSAYWWKIIASLNLWWFMSVYLSTKTHSDLFAPKVRGKVVGNFNSVGRFCSSFSLSFDEFSMSFLAASSTALYPLHLDMMPSQFRMTSSVFRGVLSFSCDTSIAKMLIAQPGLSYPHWIQWLFTSSSWILWGFVLVPRPSIVVTWPLCKRAKGSLQEATALCSNFSSLALHLDNKTVQQPVQPASQLDFVPTSPSLSLRKSTSGVPGSMFSVLLALPRFSFYWLRMMKLSEKQEAKIRLNLLLKMKNTDWD